MPVSSDDKTIREAVVQAQDILARYVEPGGPGEQDTLSALLAVVDRRDVVLAVETLIPRERETVAA